MKKEKEEDYLRKTFKSRVKLLPNVEKELTLLSRVMVHLWNLALVQCEEWLSVRKIVIDGVEMLQKEIVVQSENGEKKSMFTLVPEINNQGIERKAITAYSLNFWLTPTKKSAVFTLSTGEEIPLRLLATDPCRETLRKLAGSYQSFFELVKNKDKQARKPWQRKEEFFQTLSWSSFSLKGQVLIVPTINKTRVSIDVGSYLAREIKGKVVKHVTLAENRDDPDDVYYELNLVCAYPKPGTRTEGIVRAVDLGAGTIAVSDSTGDEFLIETRRPDGYWGKKILEVEGRADRCTKGSIKHKSRMKARRKMHNISGSQHKDHQKKLAHALCEEKVCLIIIGKPKTRLGLAQSDKGSPRQHYGVQNTGYMSRMMTLIENKATELGITVVKVADPHRGGDLEDPTAKLEASRSMLHHAVKELAVKHPREFVLKKFAFKQ